MKAVVASFKRLYEAGKVTKDDMKKRDAFIIEAVKAVERVEKK